MLNDQIQKLVNNLIQIEHVSTTLYLAMSAYMANQNYTGMASWLHLQPVPHLQVVDPDSEKLLSLHGSSFFY
ncbi:ferritin-like domain-containing protein [uncultured Rossellomorea sp.]|uniref:ferritin-like domain-containing protein n=1 Tax=uncultured Rossellomorea sp. TaxID=2837549 RepID=UPI00343AF4BD